MQHETKSIEFNSFNKKITSGMGDESIGFDCRTQVMIFFINLVGHSLGPTVKTEGGMLPL